MLPRWSCGWPLAQECTNNAGRGWVRQKELCGGLAKGGLYCLFQEIFLVGEGAVVELLVPLLDL